MLNYCNKIYRRVYTNGDSVILFQKYRTAAIFVILMVGN
jgi:hypothetical protein